MRDTPHLEESGAGTSPAPSLDELSPPICPRCEYDLRAISEPRCPECGSLYTWEQIETFRSDRPRIAFERMRGARKVWGFVSTWLSVLFAPWIFAAQAARRIHTPHALAFGAVCFLSTLLSLFFDADWPVIVSWIVAATVCILLEAGILALFDPHLRAGSRAAYGYWLLIGCYTSAVMATEFAIGPPMLMLSRMLEWFVELAQHSAGLTDVFYAVVQDDADAVICWIQIGVWIIALLCCQVARYRRRGAGSLRLVLTVAVSAPLLLILYAFCVEQVGVRVYDAVRSSF